MPTLGVEEGEASLESIEEPDFLLRMFLTEVERGGARGGGMSSLSWLTPPPTLPFRDGRDVWEVRLIEPAEQTWEWDYMQNRHGNGTNGTTCRTDTGMD